MMDIETAGRIHNILIDRFGGSKGIKIRDLLESALARPYATFEGVDLYPEPIDKAAALFESLIINHPFQDGNKRIAYVLMRLLLLKNKWISTRVQMKNMILLLRPAREKSGTMRSGNGFPIIPSLNEFLVFVTIKKSRPESGRDFHFQNFSLNAT